MYKLLLATDKPEVLSAFESIPSYVDLGFREPRVVSSARAAIESLKKHHADAIVFDLEEEGQQQLKAVLRASYPLMPIMPAARNRAKLESALGETRSLLNRLRADFSNEDFTEEDMMSLCRHEFLRALLGGKIATPSDVEERMYLLRSKMDTKVPCVVVDMALPEGDDFLSGRWHYGTDRLEMALRNFFGCELNGMRMVICVLPDSRIRMLCCPMEGKEAMTESVTATVSAHASSAIEHMSEYLHMDLQITGIQVLPAVTALAYQAN